MLIPIIASLFAVLLEVAWFGHIRPFGIIPNLAVIIVALTALWSQATPTLVAAITAGLLLDSASGTDFGLRTAFLAALAVCTIAARQLGLHADSLVAALGIVAIATILFDLAVVTSVHSAAIDWHLVASRIGIELLLNLPITATAWVFGSAWRNRQPVLPDADRGSWL